MTTIVAKIVPTFPQVARETIVVLVAALAAAFILSRFPALKNFVAANSITVNDAHGNNLY